MKSLIVLVALLVPLFSALAVNNTPASDANLVESSSLSTSEGPSLDLNAGGISETTPKNQSSMLFYVIPAAAVLLVVICLIALSKRLLFEKP